MSFLFKTINFQRESTNISKNVEKKCRISKGNFFSFQRLLKFYKKLKSV